MLFRRIGEETLGGGYITPFAQEKINGSTLLIHRAIQVAYYARQCFSFLGLQLFWGDL